MHSLTVKWQRGKNLEHGRWLLGSHWPNLTQFASYEKVPHSEVLLSHCKEWRSLYTRGWGTGGHLLSWWLLLLFCGCLCLFLCSVVPLGGDRYLEMLWFAPRTWAIQNKMDSKACRPAQTGGCWERQRLVSSVRASAPLAEFRMTSILRLETLLNGTFNLRLRWSD